MRDSREASKYRVPRADSLRFRYDALYGEELPMPVEAIAEDITA
jgi:hypothetical protein